MSSDCSTVFAEVQRNKAVFSFPNELLTMSDAALKDYLWENHGDALREAITFTRSVDVDSDEPRCGGCDSSVAEMPNTKASLEQSMEYGQQMVAMRHLVRLSHEIRSPLICVSGLASILKGNLELDDYQYQSFESMLNNVTHVVDLVDGVIQYSNLGTVEANISYTNLQLALTSVITTCEKKTQDCSIGIKTFFDSSVPEFVSTDGCLLQQILGQLILNAIKYTNDGTAVQLGVYAGTALEVEEACLVLDSNANDVISAPAKNRSTLSPLEDGRTQILRFVVKDFGRGIAEGDFSKVFEPFQQADVDQPGDYKGMGLGLAIVSRHVKCLDGKISVRSQVGVWTEFTVDFPLRESLADVKASGQKLKNATIFVVGDDEGDDLAITTLARSEVDLVKFDSCEELEVLVRSKTAIDKRRVYICLIQEDLYKPSSYKLLQNGASCALLTFGPERSVSETKCHFSSLSRTLPSVILETVISCMEITPVRPEPIIRRHSEVMKTLDFSNVKALIAEDNLINQKVLIRMLKRLGIKTIDVVDNGLKAVNCISENEYDMVFLDNQMPVMDGIEACRAIKKQGFRGHPGPEIVFVTANLSDEFMSEAYKAGGNGFIAKPFDIRAIESYFRTLSKLFLLPPSRSDLPSSPVLKI